MMRGQTWPRPMGTTLSHLVVGRGLNVRDYYLGLQSASTLRRMCFVRTCGLRRLISTSVICAAFSCCSSSNLFPNGMQPGLLASPPPFPTFAKFQRDGIIAPNIKQSVDRDEYRLVQGPRERRPPAASPLDRTGGKTPRERVPQIALMRMAREYGAPGQARYRRRVLQRSVVFPIRCCRPL